MTVKLFCSQCHDYQVPTLTWCGPHLRADCQKGHYIKFVPLADWEHLAPPKNDPAPKNDVQGDLFFGGAPK